MSITLTALQTKTLNYLNESSGTPFSTTTMNYYINEAQEQVGLWLIRLEPSFLASRSTITRVSGTSQYSLPAGFLALTRLYDTNEHNLYQIKPHERDYKQGYYFKGNYIEIWPNDVTETLYLDYCYAPTELGTVATSDLPDVCEDMIALKAASLLKTIDEESTTAKELEFRFQQKAAFVAEVLSGRDLSGTARVRKVRGINKWL